jgi:hypothetical protein
LTSSQEASPVSLFPKQESGEARKMTAISGRKCYGLYENFIPGGSSVKMLAASLLGTTEWYSDKCVLIWKKRDTKCRRLLFQLAPSVRPIEGTEYGSWLTVKTIEGTEIKMSKEDYPKVSEYKWHLEHGYPRASVSHTEKVMMHHLIVGKEKGMEVDHINRDKTDNRRENLRLVTHIENCQNREPIKGGTAYQPKGKNFWRTEIVVNGKRKNLGSFATKEEALMAYREARQTAMLPTPRSREGNARSAGSVHNQKKGYLDGLIQESGSEIGMKSPLKLAPEFVEFMMGYPLHWTDLNSPKPDTECKDLKV